MHFIDPKKKKIEEILELNEEMEIINEGRYLTLHNYYFI